tara:strand:+ start:99 stop:233 length:135 start_codon:yes stop_codon:yes gene_type:complete
MKTTTQFKIKQVWGSWEVYQFNGMTYTYYAKFETKNEALKFIKK